MAPASPKSFTVKTQDGAVRRMTQLEVSQYVRTSMQRAKLQVTASAGSSVSRSRSSQPSSPAGSVRSFRQKGPPAPEARQPDERVKLKISTEHNMSPRDLPPVSPRDLPPISPRALESIDMFQDKSISRLSGVEATNELNLMSRDDLMSAPSMMSTQSFTVATEAEGTKVLSQEEITELVRSTMQRARQRKATTPRAIPRTPSSATPRAIPRTPSSVPMSPRFSTMTSTLEDDAPPATSVSRTEKPEVIVIQEEDEEGENSPTNISARKETPEIIVVEEEEEGESSPTSVSAREESPEVIVVEEEEEEEENESSPTVMLSESVNRKFTWSFEEEQSGEDVDSVRGTEIDPVEGTSSTENITPINRIRSAIEDEDMVNSYSKDSEPFHDEKEGPAENKAPSMDGKDVVNVGGVMNKPASVEQPKSTENDKGEASSVTEGKESRPSTLPPNSYDEKNSEERTSEANKEEILIPVNDSVTEAQKHAREEIQGLLDASKTNTGEIEITTDSGEIRRMSEAEINNLFKVAMQKARESAQQEMRELVQTSMAAAREEMRGVVRDSISVATPKIEIVEVVKDPKDSSRSETPRVVSRPMQTSEPPPEPLVKQEEISSPRRQLSVRRHSPRRQKQLNEHIRQRTMLPVQRHEASPRLRNDIIVQNIPQSKSTTHNRASMLSSHKNMEQQEQDSISLPSPDDPDQGTAMVAKDSAPSPWNVDPSTQFDHGGREKQMKDSSRSPWLVDPSTQFSHGDAVEFMISDPKEVSRSNKHGAQLKEEDCERPKAQGEMEKKVARKEICSSDVVQEKEAPGEQIERGEERKEKNKDRVHLTVEAYLPESEAEPLSNSEPAPLVEEGKKTILSKAVNDLDNIEKERTQFLPIEKTGIETSTLQPKAAEAEPIASRPPISPTKRLAAIHSTPERTDNPTSSSAFTGYLSSEGAQMESILSPELPTEILPPTASDAHQSKLSAEILSPQVSDARPVKLPTEILSPNVRDAHRAPDSQWTQNLYTTRDDDNVVEEAQVATLPEKNELTSEDDDSRLELMRRQRAQLSPKGKRFRKSGEGRKLALMRKKPTESLMAYDLSEDDRGGEARSAARSAARSGTRSRKGRANRLAKEKPSPKTSTEMVKSTEKLKAPVNSRTLEMVRAEEISRDDANTPSSRGTKKSSTQSVSSLSLMLSGGYFSDREDTVDTVVTEELINRIAALKGSRVTQEELNKLLGVVTDKAQPFTKSAVKKSESNLCMDIFDLWPVREEDDEEDEIHSVASSWLEDVAIPADTYMQYQESLSTSQEQTDFAPEETLSYSFSRGQRSYFTELESGTERDESVSGDDSFSPGWWRN